MNDHMKIFNSSDKITKCHSENYYEINYMLSCVENATRWRKNLQINYERN